MLVVASFGAGYPSMQLRLQPLPIFSRFTASICCRLLRRSLSKCQINTCDRYPRCSDTYARSRNFDICFSFFEIIGAGEAMNKSAASAASPDSVKFHAVFLGHHVLGANIQPVSKMWV